MTLHDPLDDYAEMLRAEGASNDNLFDSEVLLSALLSQAALRFETNRQRLEAELEMQEHMKAEMAAESGTSRI